MMSNWLTMILLYCTIYILNLHFVLFYRWSVIFKAADGRYEVIGAVSYGSDCEAKGHPSVATRITSYLPWIREVTSNSLLDQIPLASMAD